MKKLRYILLFVPFCLFGQTTEITTSNIHEAVRQWFEKQDDAVETYGPISEWDVSGVTNMSDLFKNRTNFNEDLSEWKVSKVEDMSGMFAGASKFKCDLSGWKVENVRSMMGMFWRAETFNSELSNWKVAKVEDMSFMFWNTKSFTSDLSNWKVAKVEDMFGMFDQSGMTPIDKCATQKGFLASLGKKGKQVWPYHDDWNCD